MAPQKRSVWKKMLYGGVKWADKVGNAILPFVDYAGLDAGPVGWGIAGAANAAVAGLDMWNEHNEHENVKRKRQKVEDEMEKQQAVQPGWYNPPRNFNDMQTGPYALTAGAMGMGMGGLGTGVGQPRFGSNFSPYGM